jgi:hypothetical protein
MLASLCYLAVILCTVMLNVMILHHYYIAVRGNCLGWRYARAMIKAFLPGDRRAHLSNNSLLVVRLGCKLIGHCILLFVINFVAIIALR